MGSAIALEVGNLGVWGVRSLLSLGIWRCGSAIAIEVGNLGVWGVRSLSYLLIV
ncbi:hypothetical protein H6G80_21475 [Nostoc sp. FACHB-87]|uniref:hypothetical protein n=1 Tax=Nostocaceae TaxID=1162 RepID=UPI00168A25E8|nr:MULTISPECIES: hypothetical protein [Nostocaceae]MBD2456638.1 hypothetical protein [Nostoc sp. FACHB-87]MBD2477987.1 hypothetical protein [Anabaena sp. FACHB-83]